MPKVDQRERTTVTYESNFEIRAGEPVVVVTKRTVVIPVSGRGEEYYKRTEATETTVYPLDDAQHLAHALLKAFTWAAETIASPYQEDKIENREEPHLALGHPSEDIEYGRYYSLVEAREAAKTFFAQTGNEGLSGLVVFNTTRTEREGNLWIVEGIDNPSAKVKK